MTSSSPRLQLDLPPNQLRTFLKVARRLSFTRAAEELHLTQPAVSAHIRKLERAVGGTLFEQIGRRVSLTSTGDVLYQYAERVLALENELRAAIADAHAWALPNLRGLGKGEKAMCNWDEDVITLAVEAGRDCLRGANRSTLTAIDLASTTAPFADLQNAVLVGAALRVPVATACTDVSGSTRAGLSALLRARSAGALAISRPSCAGRRSKASIRVAGTCTSRL